MSDASTAVRPQAGVRKVKGPISYIKDDGRAAALLRQRPLQRRAGPGSAHRGDRGRPQLADAARPRPRGLHAHPPHQRGERTSATPTRSPAVHPAEIEKLLLRGDRRGPGGGQRLGRAALRRELAGRRAAQQLLPGPLHPHRLLRQDRRPVRRAQPAQGRDRPVRRACSYNVWRVLDPAAAGHPAGGLRRPLVRPRGPGGVDSSST